MLLGNIPIIEGSYILAKLFNYKDKDNIIFFDK